MKDFLSSKKAIGLILGAISLQLGAYFHAPDAFYFACGIIFGGHQVAQGMQDHAIETRKTNNGRLPGSAKADLEA